jgi:hypothetical protein
MHGHDVAFAAVRPKRRIRDEDDRRPRAQHVLPRGFGGRKRCRKKE